MSIFNKTWKFYEPAPAEFLSLENEYPDALKQLFWNRDLRNKDDLDEFLSSDYKKHTHDPFLLTDMDRAAKRILEAIDNKEKIYIYGDYDADGVCASVLLKEGLEKLGADNVPVYIPHREEEGYGMSIEALDKIIEEGAQLIITVDCGSTNVEEAKHAEEKGVDVIITDHHHVFEADSFSYALINPHRPKDKYPFKNISGTVVAFKLVQACIQKSKEDSFTLDEAKWLLDLVAIATVADVMPLTGENRVFAKYGLIVLALAKRPGVKVLMEISGIDPKYNNKEKTTNLDTFHIGFVIAPRINAAGRMDHARLAFDLLTAPDTNSARALARKLETKNEDRKNLVKDIISEINTDSFSKDPAIFEGKSEWPIGVLGIVAGRFAENHNKPSFIYQKQKDKIVGSARTPSYANTINILEQCGDVLVKFGGHAQAGGFTAEIDQESALKTEIINAVSEQIKSLDEEDIMPFVKIDTELSADDINWELYKLVEACGPFGERNPKPIFLIKNATASGVRAVGAQGDHLKCDILANNGKRFSAIGFRFGDVVNEINDGDKIDVVFELDKNEWNGNSELQLKLVDIKKLS
ncbi:MAG: single-stranded-DNA-specific exonuclease RecJ [Candidatus Spechtbacterales bacterium]